MKNLFGEKVVDPKPKVKKELGVYFVLDMDEGFGYFYVARSHGGARSAFSEEQGVDFSDTFGGDWISISRVPALDKYIKKFVPFWAKSNKKFFEETSNYSINPWEDADWTRALYSEGGGLTNSNCESPEDKELTVDEVISRECRHKDGSTCEDWNEEYISINLPPKKKSV